MVVTANDDDVVAYEVAVRRVQVEDDEAESLPMRIDGENLYPGVAAGWRFAVEAGDIVSVRVDSEAFDPVVHLLSPSGNLVARDDDGGVGSNARLVAALPDPGEYMAVVTAFDDRGGIYDVEVQEVSAATLEVGQPEQGVLR